MNTIPIEEIQADLMATRADVRRLESIVTNLEEFICDSGGEDRSAYKMDLIRYRSVLGDGQRLVARIESILERARTACAVGV